MISLLSSFLRNAADIPGPYFPGYCGEHIGDFPDVSQLSGESASSSIVPAPFQSLSTFVF